MAAPLLSVPRSQAPTRVGRRLGGPRHYVRRTPRFTPISGTELKSTGSIAPFRAALGVMLAQQRPLGVVAGPQYHIQLRWSGAIAPQLEPIVPRRAIQEEDKRAGKIGRTLLICIPYTEFRGVLWP